MEWELGFQPHTERWAGGKSWAPSAAPQAQCPRPGRFLCCSLFIFFHQQEEVTFPLGVACLNQKVPSATPFIGAKKTVWKRLALHCDDSLAMHKRTQQTSVRFLVTFHLQVCEKPIRSFIQLVFIKRLPCARRRGIS